MQVKAVDTCLVIVKSEKEELRIPVREFIASFLRDFHGISPHNTMEVNATVKTAVLDALKNSAEARRRREEELQAELNRLKQCDR